MKKYFFIAVILAAVFFYFAVYFNLYPILKVNGDFILAKEYYARLGGLESYRRATGEEADENIIRRGFVLSLIINKRVSEELSQRQTSPNEDEKRVSDAVESDLTNLENAAWKLYGWDIKEFERFSLLPQARRDVLAEKLTLEGVDISERLSQKALEAEVKIYFLPYYWELGNLFEKK